jgi:hypothetical protein
MDTSQSLGQGAILEGPFWNEPVRVIAARRIAKLQEIEAEGLRTGRFYRSTLTSDQMASPVVWRSQAFRALKGRPMLWPDGHD